MLGLKKNEKTRDLKNNLMLIKSMALMNIIAFPYCTKKGLKAPSTVPMHVFLVLWHDKICILLMMSTYQNVKHIQILIMFLKIDSHKDSPYLDIQI
jgi:hypothetical protein